MKFTQRLLGFRAHNTIGLTRILTFVFQRFLNLFDLIFRQALLPRCTHLSLRSRSTTAALALQVARGTALLP